jgi:hypothetical protein
MSTLGAQRTRTPRGSRCSKPLRLMVRVRVRVRDRVRVRVRARVRVGSFEGYG